MDQTSEQEQVRVMTPDAPKWGPDDVEPEIKCSAVHSLERDIPDFDYSDYVAQLKELILAECESNVGMYSQSDINKCLNDEWFVARFLLRQKLDVDKALDMMKRAMRFRNESLSFHFRPEDIPREFYLIGGVFRYEPDRKGNKMLYVRIKIHRRIPEISEIVRAFLLHNILILDEEAKGRGKYVDH